MSSGEMHMEVRRETANRVRETGVPLEEHLKDYLLGWFLHGVSDIEAFSKSLFLRNGVALYKCFRDGGRFTDHVIFSCFSEDLDAPAIESFMNEACRVATSISGSAYAVEEGLAPVKGNEGHLRMKVACQPFGDENAAILRLEFHFHFDRPLHEKAVVYRPSHPYPDLPYGGLGTLNCAALPEILAERILLASHPESSLPSLDLYDLYSFRKELRTYKRSIRRVLELLFHERKYRLPETADQLFDESLLESYRKRWKNELTGRVRRVEFPEFETAMAEIVEAVGEVMTVDLSQPEEVDEEDLETGKEEQGAAEGDESAEAASVREEGEFRSIHEESEFIESAEEVLSELDAVDVASDGWANMLSSRIEDRKREKEESRLEKLWEKAKSDYVGSVQHVLDELKHAGFHVTCKANGHDVTRQGVMESQGSSGEDSCILRAEITYPGAKGQPSFTLEARYGGESAPLPESVQPAGTTVEPALVFHEAAERPSRECLFWKMSDGKREPFVVIHEGENFRRVSLEEGIRLVFGSGLSHLHV